MKVTKEAMKEIMKSPTAKYRKTIGRFVNASSDYFVDNYWKYMTEKKANRNLDFEAKIIRILDLNNVDGWDSKQWAKHIFATFSHDISSCCDYQQDLLNKKLHKDYPDLHFKVKSSSIKVLNEEGDVLFKAKANSSVSKMMDQFTYKIDIESAEFTYGTYFKDKEEKMEMEGEER